jgi:hypothetical protein
MLKMGEQDRQPDYFVNALPQGIGAALTINAHTRAMNKFFGNLPPNYGVPIDPDTAHVTLIDARLTAIPIQSERDLIALRKTGGDIHRRLASLPLQEIVLSPDSDELERFGRYLAIPLRQTPVMEMLRTDLAEIIEEGLAVKLDSNFDAHMSVVRPRRTRVKTQDNLPPFPSNLHVSGFDMQRRVIDKSQHSPSPRARYINRRQRQPSLRAV